MKSFKTLLKIAKRELETLRRALASANQRLSQVDAKLVIHDHTVEGERQLAVRDYDSTRAFASYSVLAAQKRAVMQAEKSAIETEIDELRRLIAEAHTETRKFERLIELEEERERVRREKREDAELDEMATLRAGRMTP